MKWKLLAGVFSMLLAICICGLEPVQVGRADENDDYEEVRVSGTKIRNAKALSRDSLRLTWGKRRDVDGYIIYSIDRNRKPKQLVTVEGAEASGCVINKLEYDTFYRFRVRTYRKVKGVTYRSAYDEDGFRTKIRVKGRYEGGYKYFYDWNRNRVEDVMPFLGESPTFQIQTNITRCTTTVYAKDGVHGFTIPVRAWICSPGRVGHETPVGVWNLGEKYRYRSLFNNSFSQWAVRIQGNILFHTVPYAGYGNNNTLKAEEYNKLGEGASLGCIRMPCEGVKWIFDYCPSGKTQVVIFRSDAKGPMDVSESEDIPDWHTWDPTDPTTVDLCREHHCHQDRI